MALTRTIILLSLAVRGLVAQSTTDLDISSDSCPSDWGLSTFGNGEYCCFGSSVIVDNDGYCCVGNEYSYDKRDVTTEGPPSCATTVDYTDPDYSSKVSAASSSVMSETGSQPASTSANPTSGDSTAAATSTTGTASNTGTPSKATGNTATASSATNAAMPMRSRDGRKIGGVMAVAALLAV